MLSSAETITISASSSTPTEMLYDGFITGSLGHSANQLVEIYINNVRRCRSVDVGNNGSNPFCLPVNKGDKVYNPQNSVEDVYAMFYKLRDYSNRN